MSRRRLSSVEVLLALWLGFIALISGLAVLQTWIERDRPSPTPPAGHTETLPPRASLRRPSPAPGVGLTYLPPGALPRRDHDLVKGAPAGRPCRAEVNLASL